MEAFGAKLRPQLWLLMLVQMDGICSNAAVIAIHIMWFCVGGNLNLNDQPLQHLFPAVSEGHERKSTTICEFIFSTIIICSSAVIQSCFTEC